MKILSISHTAAQNTISIRFSTTKNFTYRNMFITGPFTDPVVYDFWLMIWQQKPSAIVMVTKAIENTKVRTITHSYLYNYIL